MQVHMVINHHPSRKDKTIWTQTIKYKYIKFHHDKILGIAPLYMYQLFTGKEAWWAFPTARNFHDLTWVYQSVQTKLFCGNKWPLYLATHSHKNLLFKFICITCLLWFFSPISSFWRDGTNMKLFLISAEGQESWQNHTLTLESSAWSIISAHIALAKASHTVKPFVNEMGRLIHPK